MRARAGLILAALGLAAAVPSVAQAHLLATGMGPIYDGVTHFGLSPEDYLPVIALAFLAGLRGRATTRLVLAVLPIAWLAGGLMALAGLTPPVVVMSSATAAMFLAIGGLLAGQRSDAQGRLRANRDPGGDNQGRSGGAARLLRRASPAHGDVLRRLDVRHARHARPGL